MGQDSEMDQSSYLTPDTNRTRGRRGEGKRLKKDELTKNVLGVKRNNKGTMKDGSSTDEGRGPTLGLTDVGSLTKSL